MPSREKFEDKLAKITEAFEELASEMLDRIDELEGDKADVEAERDEFWERLNELEGSMRAAG